MAMLETLGESARKVYRDMTVTQRLAILMVGLTAALSLGLMTFVGSISEERGQVILPITVEIKDYDTVDKILKDNGIQGTYNPDDKRFLVPIKQKNDAYLLLAREGLYGKESASGFEAMIEKMDYSVGTETRRDMMRTALQNELNGMIESIETIERARVVFAEGEKKVFGTPIKPQAAVKV
ncbi:MAG: hypothetical protein V1918_09960, partial [Planctomycetota bacterium]